MSRFSHAEWGGKDGNNWWLAVESRDFDLSFRRHHQPRIIAALPSCPSCRKLEILPVSQAILSPLVDLR